MTVAGVGLGTASARAVAPTTPKRRIPAGAGEAWEALQRALGDTDTPCQSGPGDWYADDVAGRDVAARACRGCALLAACGEYAGLADERFGVWGGRDRSPHRRPVHDRRGFQS